MPVAGMALERLRWPWVRYLLAVIFLSGGLSPVFNNPSRSLVPSENAGLFDHSRVELLFANAPEYKQGYLSLTSAARATGCRSFGLVIDSHDPEYPLWALLSPSGSNVHIEHMDNNSAYRPCAILCTICSDPSLYSLPLHSAHYGGYTLYTNP
jgi:hypothetical protein